MKIHFPKWLVPIYMSTEISVDHTSDPELSRKAVCWPSEKLLKQTCPLVEEHWDGIMCLLPDHKHQGMSAVPEERIRATNSDGKTKLLSMTPMCFIDGYFIIYFP